MSLVSVIVPIYNAQEHLAQCIDSIRNQSLQELEIILINDGSTDASPAICDAYAKKDPRIQVIHQANTGQGIARNKAIDRARSPYIGFVDADDWIEADMYEKMVKAATENKADITMCNCVEMFCGLEQATQIKTTTNLLNHDQIIEELLCPMVGGLSLQDHYENTIPGYVCRCLYTREIIGDLRFISEREIAFEDLWFNIQAMYKSSTITIVPHALYHYVHHKDSFVRTYREGLWESQRILENLIIEFFTKHKIIHLIRRRLQTRRLIDLFSSINNQVYKQNPSTIKEQKQAMIKMATEKETVQALKEVPWGEISMKQKIRIIIIQKQWFNLLYLVAKGEYKFKKRG